MTELKGDNEMKTPKEKIAEMEKDNNYEPEYIGGYKEALEDVRALIENEPNENWSVPETIAKFKNKILEELK